MLVKMMIMMIIIFAIGSWPYEKDHGAEITFRMLSSIYKIEPTNNIFKIKLETTTIYLTSVSKLDVTQG